MCQAEYLGIGLLSARRQSYHFLSIKAPSVHKGRPILEKAASGSVGWSGVSKRGSVRTWMGYWYLRVKKDVCIEERPNIGSKSLDN